MKPTLRREKHFVIDPGEYTRVVGQSFVKRERQALLQIGNLTWTRWSLGRMGCPHPMAAANLNRVVQDMKITSLSDLADRAQEIGTFKGLGVTAYWTVLTILREAGYDVAKVHDADVTYSSLKQRAIKQEERERPKRRRG
jgi:hypothetical protein